TGPGTTLVLVSAGRATNKTFEHSSGVLAVAGPGINAGKRIQGARLVDLVPTLLHAFDLPVGEDMEGRVLEEVFQEKSQPDFIPSWRNEDEFQRKDWIEPGN